MNVGLISILMIVVFFILGYVVGAILTKYDLKNTEPNDGTLIIDGDDNYYPRLYSFESVKRKKVIRLKVVILKIKR